MDDSGVPTKRYSDYRNSEISRKVLAEGIKEGYLDLFRTFPDAYKQEDKKIKGFFSSVSRLGETAINYMVGTFQALCSMADFDGEYVPTQETGGTSEDSDEKEGQTLEISRAPEIADGSTVTINVNLQLSLPETKDYEVYDKIFESLKKNLLDRK